MFKLCESVREVAAAVVTDGHRLLRLLKLPALVFLGLFPIAAASVGSGSPNSSIQGSFIEAFNRGRFSQLVSLPPVGDVRSLGSPGLVQEYSSKAVPSVTYALVTPDPALPADPATFQIFGDIYTFFNTLGVATVGYPLADTGPCPANIFGICDYQVFSKGYALFVFSPSNALSVHEPFFSEWNNDGGIQIFGPAVSAQLQVTSVSTVVGSEQQFAAGAIFSYPAAAASPLTFGVFGAFSNAFQNAGGFGHLGFPTSDPFPVGTSGLVRQTFENGRIEIQPGSSPAVLYSIASLGIDGQSQGLTLAVGGSAALMAFVEDTLNELVTGRTLSWTTSDGSVVKVTGSGDTATVQALASGAASIYVSGEGKTGGPMIVRVGSSCCAIGQGAASPAAAQAFQDSVARNHLSVQAPTAVVARLGNGYIQTFTSSDGSDTRYVVSLADGSGLAYLLADNLSSAYLASGGFAGPLGYPASDPLPGGSQIFTSGEALGGLPVRLIPASIATKWFQEGGPAGLAGNPVSDQEVVVSSSGSNGIYQVFVGGEIFAVTSGSGSGRAFFSSGLILNRYLVLGGVAGVLGLPLSDVTGNSVMSESFEGGYIDLQPGAGAAVEHLNPRHPALSISAASVAPGGSVRIAATGFAPGATLSFTISGQPGFNALAASGSFAWSMVVPLAAKPAAITIQVAAQASADSAVGTFLVISVASSLPKLTVVSGDRQSGLPGSLLSSPIVASLKDGAGDPLPFVQVAFSSSPGAVGQSSFVTDQNGQVSVQVRLPASSGVVVGSLTAASQVVSFSALAASGGVPNFPVFSESNSGGGEVASLAALFRYYQNLGYLPALNGLATPEGLGGFLTSNGGYAQAGLTGQVANPWIAAEFAAAGLWIDAPSSDHIRDLLNAGTPSVVVLRVTVNGAPYNGVAVNAVGVAGDGSIVIDDPSPVFARTSLTDYLNGFQAQGNQVQGIISAVLRAGVSQPAPGAAPFTLAAPAVSAFNVSSPAGTCTSVDIPDEMSSASERFQYCDGTQGIYEADFGAQTGAVVADLTGGPQRQIPSGAGANWQVERTKSTLTVAPQSIQITAVTDAASFGSGLAPGELITIFGGGFSSGQKTIVTINGASIPVLNVFPFQINALIPAGVSPGTIALTVQDGLGSAIGTAVLSPSAPAIFTVGAGGAIVNQDGALNSPQDPAQRGQYISIYCTGLGATALSAGLQVVTAPVLLTVNTIPIIPTYAGLVSGYPGVYQVNATIPAGMPPATMSTLAIKQGAYTSNTVPLALQ